jgi:hypothetical protein
MTIFSRRRFLQQASGTLSPAWEGLRIFAGPLAPATDTKPDPSSPSAQHFVYGTHFCRPLNPPASIRREMPASISRENDFNIIRIYPAWVYYDPAADRFVLGDLEEVLKYCDELGLRALMGAVTEQAPGWLERFRPETGFIDTKGNFQRLSDSDNNVSGGWPEAPRRVLAEYLDGRNGVIRHVE